MTTTIEEARAAGRGGRDERQPEFVIFGAAGYVARKHMEAIRAVGGRIVAVVDPRDSIGIVDQLAPGADYYADVAEWIGDESIERFGPWVVVCTPNDLHVGHALAASAIDCPVIVEKPVALDMRTLDALATAPTEIHPILNLRCSPAAIRLHDECARASGWAEVAVEYAAPRGPWYERSWKADTRRSGGLATNIGIHVLDLLTWTFGGFRSWSPTRVTERAVEGRLYLERADVLIALSLDGPAARRVSVDGMTYDLGDLAGTHVESYRRILAGRGWTLDDTSAAIECAERMRGAL